MDNIPTEYLRSYDSRTDKTTKINKKVKYHLHHQTYTEGQMSLKTLKDLGANIRTLVWEYLSSNMSYENTIHPNIHEMSEQIGCNRSKVSNALTQLEKKLLIIELSGNRKGRIGREFMIDPYRVNRGPSEQVPGKRKKWTELVKEYSKGEETLVEVKEKITESEFLEGMEQITEEEEC